MVENYTLKEFLGVLLVGFPVYLILAVFLLKGIYWLAMDFFVGGKQNVFHHHYYYKDRGHK
jgi:hypothetical protein